VGDLERLKERHQLYRRKMIADRICDFDVRSFYLERDITRLERQYPKVKDSQAERRWRLDRMKVRADLEILKIEMADIERQAASFGVQLDTQ
jgi:hypothetical protein